MKKDLYAILYAVTSILILGSLIYYQLILQKDLVERFDEDDRLIQLAGRQEMYSQQITKAAVGMGYSRSERNFIIFQNELKRVLPEWNRIHRALIADNQQAMAELGISGTASSTAYNELKEAIKLPYASLNSAASSMTSLQFAADETDINYRSLRASVATILQNANDYLLSARQITNFFFENSQSGKTSFDLLEKVAIGILVGLFFLQGFVIFRPLWKLATENYATANKAFVRLKNSEQELRVSYEKQKKANKQLLISRQQLANNLKKLKESESKLLASTKEQIEINDRLLVAQNELKNAYSKLQESEVDMRQMTEKQLEDNEKLFFAEKQLKEALEAEKRQREELNKAMSTLKGAQAQLVHSEKMASLGQLTAGIAHEINNPINFISSGMKSIEFIIEALMAVLNKYDELEKDIGKTEEIMKEVKDLKSDHEYEEILEELEVMIKDVNYGVSRTIEIVKGLRIFSRLDEEEMKKANVNENLDATLILLRNKTKNRIKVSKYYEENMGQIDCYPGQLNQVFMNIMNNAIQAIPEERNDGELSLYTEEQEEHVVVRIKDNGVGIPEDVVNRIWEPFFTTKPVGVGTGLGMSITYSIIEKHHGQIELESEVGKGTEFIITLPRVGSNVAKEVEKETSSATR